MEEEKKGQNDNSQINSSPGTTQEKIRALEEQLDQLKFDHEDKEKLTEIFESGADNVNEQVHNFLKDMGEKKKLNHMQKKQLGKIAPLYDTHDFWDSQPVPKAHEKVTESDLDKPIDVEKTVDQIREEPLDIPPGFYWSNINIENDEECKEVYELLTQNYVEDDDNMFRFDYQVKFLQWALTPPGYNKDWLFGVRGGKKNKLFGFISGIPVDVTANGKHMKMAEINFLCVHKSLRTKRLAPVLIKEVTRRVNRCDMWQAIYTAGIVIPTPIAVTTYWHRSLNPKKLVEVGFSALPKDTPMSRFVKLYKLPAETSIVGLRPMEKKDVPVVTKKLNTFLQQFKMHIQFNEAEVAHFLLPQEWVIESFVVEDPKTDEITDFFSFYSLPSSILRHDTHKTL